MDSGMPDPLSELPLGFGMALMRNPAAARRFETMTPQQQQAVLNQTHAVNSKEEMRDLVRRLEIG